MERAEAKAIAMRITHKCFDDYFELINLSHKRRRSKREAYNKVEKVISEAEKAEAKAIAEEEKMIAAVISEIEEELNGKTKESGIIHS